MVVEEGKARAPQAGRVQANITAHCVGDIGISAIRNTIGAAFAAADEMRTKHAAGAD